MIDVKAKIKDLSKSLFDSKVNLTLEFEGNPADFEEFIDKDLRISIKQWHKKRSINANSYFWVLLDKLAVKLNQSKTELYRAYIKDIGGVSETVCVRNIAVDDLCKAWESKGLGWQTDRLTCNVKNCTNVILYYGSSMYDTAQMSRLLDMVVRDCEEQGIHTMTENEINELKQRWGNEI